MFNSYEMELYSAETKNSQNNTLQETVYIWKLNYNMVQNITSVSKDVFILKMAAWESSYVFNERVRQSFYLEKVSKLLFSM